VRRSNTNLVEIDLVRGGRRVLVVDEECIPEECASDYIACINDA